MSQASELGIVKGVKVLITAQHKPADLIAVHKFKIGQVVTLKRDDGSFAPLFTDGKNEWFVRLDCVTKVDESVGPKSNRDVKWSDAPHGATHYSGYAGHTNRWHKLDAEGNWYFYREKFLTQDRGLEWVGPYINAYPETQEPIPTSVEKVLSNLQSVLDKVQKRLTRTGSKKGRAEKRLAEVNKAFDGLQKEQETLKQQIAEAKAVIATAPAEVVEYYTLEQIYQISKDPSQWKVGMKVKSVNDSETDIEIGDVFTLTDDADDSNMIHFRDNADDPRYRDGDDYELVWVDLVGKRVIK